MFVLLLPAELQDCLNDLVDGIKDGDNEYTKLSESSSK